jgi:hypothetical protein
VAQVQVTPTGKLPKILATACVRLKGKPMSTLRIGEAVYQEFLAARALQGKPPMSRDRFALELKRWYRSFWNAHCSLGFAANKLGLNKAQLIDLLDMLGWKVSNMGACGRKPPMLLPGNKHEMSTP